MSLRERLIDDDLVSNESGTLTVADIRAFERIVKKFAIEGDITLPVLGGHEAAAGETPVILARLTPCEYEAFMECKIPYSGATGRDAEPELYHGLAPYIATFLREMPRVAQVLSWSLFTVAIAGNQWIVQRGKFSRYYIYDNPYPEGV